MGFVNNTPMENIKKGRFAYIQFVGDILYVKFRKGKRIDILAANEIVAQRMTFHKDKALAVICDVSNVRFVDLAAREYLAIEGSIFVKVLAIVAKHKTAAVMVQHFLVSYPPELPTGVFNNKLEATQFIVDELNKMNEKEKK